MDKDKITKKELGDFKSRTNELITALDNIYSEIEKYQKSAKAFSDAESKFQASATTLGELATDIKEAVSKLEEYIGGLYNLSTEDMITKITNLHSDTEAIKTECNNLQKDIAAFTKISEQITTFDTTTAAMTKSVVSLDKSLAKVYESISNLDKKLEENTNSFASLEKRLSKLETLLTDVYSSEQKVRDDNSELRDQIAKLLQKLSEKPTEKTKRKVLFGRK